MKFACLLLCAAALMAQTPSTQNVQKVLYFTNISTQQDTRDLVTALRTVADLQQATVDETAHSLTVSAAADKIALAEWLFKELDQVAPPPANTVIHEYPLPVQAPGGPEVAKVYYLAHANTQGFLTDMVTNIRTVADVIRLHPDNKLHAIIARSTPDRMAAGEWLVHEFDQPAGSVQAPAVHQYSKTLALSSRESNTLKIFYLANAVNQQAMTDMITAMRTLCDANRLFPFNAAKAIVVSAPSDRVAAAEWMFHDIDRPASDSYSVSTYGVPLKLSPMMDESTLKVFHLSPLLSTKDLTDLLTTIRTTAKINRIFPLAIPRAIALYGTPAGLAQAETLIKQKDQPAAQ